MPHPSPIVFFLPARDEEPTVASVIERMPTDVAGHPVLPVVIDDGSTDRTADEARSAGAAVVPCVGTGLGAAVRTGLGVAAAHGAAAAVFCDADGEYDPAEVAGLVEPILTDRADYVVGSRFAGRQRRMLPHRSAGNRLLTRLTAWAARLPVTDGQSGYRALSATAIARAEIVHDYNYAQVLTLDLAAKGARYAEVPITYARRTTGRSYVRPGRYLRAVLPQMWALRIHAGAIDQPRPVFASAAS